ncbi:glycosyltransferase [Candidatus Dependentiae bacterium]|nr:glycosyltransferase [Candidatus Dependentiae bacterium]
MKIFHVITSLKIGGAEKALLNFLQKSINDKNEHIIAYFYPGPILKKIIKLGFKTYQIKGLFFKYDFFAFYKLKKTIKKNKPDIIHSSLWSANFLSKIIAKSLGIPIICDLHSNFMYDGKIRRLIENLTLLKADKYVAVSYSVKEGFLSSFKKKFKKLEPKITVIPNAINIDNIKNQKQKLKRKDLGFNKNDFIIGAVGRLEKIKSYDLLIKSFAQVLSKIKKINSLNKNLDYLKPIKLCIVGDGSEKSYLEDLTKKLDIQKDVTFTGIRNDINQLYPLFDCLCISSKSEGLSIVLLEALSFGLPIITTSQTEKHDVIINNKNGLIVPTKNIEKFSTAIESLYLNPNLIKKININNKKLASQKFCIDRLIKQYDSLYQKLLAK